MCILSQLSRKNTGIWKKYYGPNSCEVTNPLRKHTAGHSGVADNEAYERAKQAERGFKVRRAACVLLSDISFEGMPGHSFIIINL